MPRPRRRAPRRDRAQVAQPAGEPQQVARARRSGRRSTARRPVPQPAPSAACRASHGAPRPGPSAASSAAGTAAGSRGMSSWCRRRSGSGTPGPPRSSTSSAAGRRCRRTARRTPAGRVSSDGPVSKRKPSRRYSPSLPPCVSARSCSLTACPCAASRAAAAEPADAGADDHDALARRLTAHAVDPSSCNVARQRGARDTPGAAPATPSSAATDTGWASASGQTRPRLRRAAITRVAAPAA